MKKLSKIITGILAAALLITSLPVDSFALINTESLNIKSQEDITINVKDGVPLAYDPT